MKHWSWQELIERLPPKIRVAITENTAQVLAELDRAERKQHREGRHDDESDPASTPGLMR